jgi:rod shape-determining protein MreC
VAPPSRSARAAVLASSVQRSKPTPYPSKARSALIRRAVVVGLVLVALTLITIAFRSPTSGALHSVQGAGSTALRPFQIAATRVAQPFRDGYDYLSSLSGLKAQNARLKRQYATVREQAIANRALAVQAEQYKKLLHFEERPTFPGAYRTVNTAVISYPSGVFAHSLTIAAGSASGVRKNAPVVSGYGLVGIVSDVSPHTALVRLLTDPSTYVAGFDLQTRVHGMIHTGTGGTLVLDQVPKRLKVKKQDVLVTAGTSDAQFPDLYPYGIPIGRVSNVGAEDTATFLQVQVQPFSNVSSLDAVGVLVPKKSGR